MSGLAPGVAVLLVATPVLFGDALLRAGCGPAAGRGAGRLGRASLVGSVVLAAAYGATIALGLDRGATVVGFAALALTPFLDLVARRRARNDAAEVAVRPVAKGGGIERATFAAVVLLLLLAATDRALVARATPVSMNDEMFIWDVRGKALRRSAETGESYGALVSRRIATPAGPHAPVYHADYPLFVPLLAAAAHELAGGDADVDARLLPQLLNLALVLCLADALRRRLRPAAAAVLLLAAAGARASVYDGWMMADTAIALGLLLALDVLDRGEEGATVGGLLAGACGAAAAAASKNEGALAVGVLAITAVATGRAPGARRRALVVGGAGVAVAVVGAAINARLGLINDHLGGRADGGTFLDVLWRLRNERPAAAASAALRDVLFGFETNGGVVLVALWLAALRRTAGRPPPSPAGPALVLTAGAVACVFAGTYHDFDWQWATAGVRVFGQLTPGFALWAASSAGALLPSLAAFGAPADAAYHRPA